MSEKPISPLRQRMLEDMNMRRFVPDTQREYIRARPIGIRGLDNGRALQDLLHQAAPQYIKALKRERAEAKKSDEESSANRLLAALPGRPLFYLCIARNRHHRV